MLSLLGTFVLGPFVPDWLEMLIIISLWFTALLVFGCTYIVACASLRQLGIVKFLVVLLWPILAGLLGAYVSAYHAYDTLAVSTTYFQALGLPSLIILQFVWLVRQGGPLSSATEGGPTAEPKTARALAVTSAVLAGACILFPLFFVSNCVVLTVDWQHDPPAELLARTAVSRINKDLAESEKWDVEIIKMELGRKPANYRRQILYNTIRGRGQVIYNHTNVYARGRRGNETRYWRLDISADGLIPYFRTAETEQALAGRWLESEYDPSQVSMY